jgi:uncharacterized cupredoxin-like copper-binding protein
MERGLHGFNGLTPTFSLFIRANLPNLRHPRSIVKVGERLQEEKKMSRIIVVLLAFVVVWGVACSPAAEGHMEDGDHVVMGMEVREIVVDANDDFSFSPAQIEVRAGEPVRLIFNNAGALEHDWSIAHIAATDVHEMSDHSDAHGDHMDSMGEDPDLHVSAMPGQNGILEFTPTEAGTYEITCTVAGHHEAGMVGTLVVTE